MISLFVYDGGEMLHSTGMEIAVGYRICPAVFTKVLAEKLIKCPTTRKHLDIQWSTS